jgi:flagellar operon protein
VVVDEAEQARLTQAVDKLMERGAKESLVLTADAAYVVGVPQRTVITAMSRSEALGQIFTQIDSTFVSD